jgi:exopolysaccharide production protein ExoQ
MKSSHGAADRALRAGRQPTVPIALLSGVALYVMLNFDTPLNRKLQPLIGAVALALLVSNARHGRTRLPHALATLWILGSAFVFARGAGTAEYGIRLAAAAITPIAIVTACGPARSLRVFTTTVIAAVLTSVVVAILIPSVGVMPSGVEWRGLFTHKNTFGFACGLTVIACLGELGAGTPGRSRSRLLMLGISGAVLSLVMARSATAIAVTVFAAGLTITLCTYSVQRRSPAVTGFAMCLALSPLALMLAAPDRVFGALGRDGTLTGRSEIWRLVIEAQSRSEHPWLGRGLGFWSAGNRDAVEIWQRVRWTPYSSHSSYLDWWLLFGTISIAILAWWILSTCYHAARVSTRCLGFAALLPLALFVVLSSITEQYLISPNGVATLSFVSAVAAWYSVTDLAPATAETTE